MEMRLNEAGLAVLQAAATIMAGHLANPANTGSHDQYLIDMGARSALELAQRIHSQECYRDTA